MGRRLNATHPISRRTGRRHPASPVISSPRLPELELAHSSSPWALQTSWLDDVIPPALHPMGALLSDARHLATSQLYSSPADSPPMYEMDKRRPSQASTKAFGKGLQGREWRIGEEGAEGVEGQRGECCDEERGRSGRCLRIRQIDERGFGSGDSWAGIRRLRLDSRHPPTSDPFPWLPWVGGKGEGRGPSWVDWSPSAKRKA
ncbi:hypothetical protein FA13DRAFT_1174940 [Coprinellus micaceus]|uniref:Uncharacterized protein n=1 Tax=Coprinellus micaceus TaxID=71717 RepID=A0A4Y7STP1_COPMI|nr:hypothetical protein FA13DRAFT_1174940 [Coprinellus micaceus]